MFRLPGSSVRPFQTVITRSGSGKGRPRRSVAFTTLNISVFAPMPSASVRTAVATNPGCRRHVRSA